MKLIDKDALVAEIEKRRDKIKKGIFSIPLTGRERASATFEYEILGNIRDFLYTLEVKEVDLDWQDIYSILYLERIVQHEFGDHEYSNEDLCQEVLKRFKAQKGEEV